METSSAILDSDMQTIKEQLNEVMTAVGMQNCKIDMFKDSNDKKTSIEKYVLKVFFYNYI